MSFQHDENRKFSARQKAMLFEHQKRQFLSKPDKSSAHAIDKAILPLVRLINSKKDFYTTSSCAGRIILIKETGKKREKVFLFKKHAPVSFNEIKKALKNAGCKETIYLKHEPCIMHIACSTFNDAIALTSAARNAGWKKSGIISRKNIVEMLSTEILAAPVACKGKILVPDAYLKFLVNECNKKLAGTRIKIKKLEKLLK